MCKFNPLPTILYTIIGFVCVIVDFLFELIFSFQVFLGMVVYANKYKTKEKEKLIEIKN